MAGTFGKYPVVNPGKQLVVGTPQTVNGTLTSATFVAFTNTPTITFTAKRSSNFIIFCSGTFAGATSTAGCKVRINATAGSPTVIFSEEGAWDQNGGTFQTHVLAYQLVTLVAGTSYTFQLEGQASAGALAIDNASPTNGIAITALEIS